MASKYQAYKTQWARDNREKAKNSYLKWRFGITIETYTEMAEAQGFVCDICKQPETYKGRALSVDHCHETKRIRSLLCTACNVSLGKFKDDPALLRAAADYIERHRLA